MADRWDGGVARAMEPAPGWPAVRGGSVGTGEKVPACGGLLSPTAGMLSARFVPPGSASREDPPDGAPGVVPATTGDCLGVVTVHHCPGAGGLPLGLSTDLP